MDWLRTQFPALAEAVGEYKVTGERAKGRCPNHTAHRNGDKHHSFLLKLADNGGVIFSCRGGCSKSQVLQAAGLRWQDVCTGGFKKAIAMSTLVKAYQYRSPEGDDVFQVCRYHPKYFRQRRRLPQCGQDWVYNMVGGVIQRLADESEPSGWKWAGVERPKDYKLQTGELHVPPCEIWPYNADLLHAYPEKIVLWVAGEKDCETASDLGLLSTTLPGGEGSRFWDKRFTKMFKGRNVVVIPDNDRPGEEYAAWVAGRLVLSDAASVAVMDLPNVPPSGDLSDWVFRNRDGDKPVTPDGKAATDLKAMIAKTWGYGRKKIADLFA